MKNTVKKVDQLIANYEDVRKENYQPVVLTEEMKEKMIQQEPTESQIEKLKKLKVPQDVIDSVETKLEASELIEERIVEIERYNSSRKITEKMIGMLTEKGYKYEDVKDLSLGDGKKLIRHILNFGKDKKKLVVIK